MTLQDLGLADAISKGLIFELGLTDGQIRAIGLVTAYWGSLDVWFNTCLLVLAEQPEVKSSGEVYVSSHTFKMKLDAWTRMVGLLTLDGKQMDALQTARQTIAGVKGDRDWITHGLWSPGAHPQTGRVRTTSVKFHNAMKSKIKVVDEAAILAIANRVREARNILITATMPLLTRLPGQLKK